MFAVSDALAVHFFLAIAGDLLEAGIGGEEAELPVEDEDTLRRVLEDGGGQALLFLGFALRGDITAGTDHADGAAVVVPLHHAAIVLQPAPVPLLVAQPVDGVIAVGLALEVGDHAAADGGEVVRVNQLLEITEEVAEVFVLVAEQPVKIGVVVGAGVQVPVPQTDIAGLQRQFQALAGGGEFPIGHFQRPGTLADHGFEPVVGLLQAPPRLLPLTNLLRQLFVQRLGVGAGPIQVIDQGGVADLQVQSAVRGAVDVTGGEKQKTGDGQQGGGQGRIVRLCQQQLGKGGGQQQRLITHHGEQMAAVSGQRHDAQADAQAAQGQLRIEQGFVRRGGLQVQQQAAEAQQQTGNQHEQRDVTAQLAVIGIVFQIPGLQPQDARRYESQRQRRPPQQQ